MANEEQRTKTARAYRDLTGSPAWPVVAEDLSRAFGANPFRAGRPDETAFYCGAQAVLDHVGEQVRLAEQQEQALPMEAQTRGEG